MDSLTLFFFELQLYMYFCVYKNSSLKDDILVCVATLRFSLQSYNTLKDFGFFLRIFGTLYS
jgi:hypothetical protein